MPLLIRLRFRNELIRDRSCTETLYPALHQPTPDGWYSACIRGRPICSRVCLCECLCMTSRLIVCLPCTSQFALRTSHRSGGPDVLFHNYSRYYSVCGGYHHHVAIAVAPVQYLAPLPVRSSLVTVRIRLLSFRSPRQLTKISITQ